MNDYYYGGGKKKKKKQKKNTKKTHYGTKKKKSKKNKKPSLKLESSIEDLVSKELSNLDGFLKGRKTKKSKTSRKSVRKSRKKKSSRKMTRTQRKSRGRYAQVHKRMKTKRNRQKKGGGKWGEDSGRSGQIMGGGPRGAIGKKRRIKPGESGLLNSAANEVAAREAALDAVRTCEQLPPGVREECLDDEDHGRSTDRFFE